MEETGKKQVTDKLNHIMLYMLYQVHLTMSGIRAHNFIGVWYRLHILDSCKSNYHTNHDDSLHMHKIEENMHAISNTFKITFDGEKSIETDCFPCC